MNNQKVHFGTLGAEKDAVERLVEFCFDGSYFVVAKNHHLSVYQTDPLKLINQQEIKVALGKAWEVNGSMQIEPYAFTDGEVAAGPITKARMVLKSNFIGIVIDNLFLLWDDMKSKIIMTMKFDVPILNFHITKNVIIVALGTKLAVYSFGLEPKLLKLLESLNPSGVLDMVITPQHSGKTEPEDALEGLFIASPARTIGQIQICNGSNTSIIKAHLSAIQCIKISSNGHLMASASKTGTIIRIHDTRTCSLIGEFRRGLDKVTITNMKFNMDDSMLAVLSDKNTLHIYKLHSNVDLVNAHNKTHALNKLPVPMPPYFQSKWSFITKTVSDSTDQGEIQWTDLYSLVIVWKKSGVWEKWSTDHENGEVYKLVRLGWKQL